MSNPVMPWMVEHAADLYNKYQSHADGENSYFKLKGKGYGGETESFGSKVMIKVMGKIQGGVMAERWYPGIFLGKRFHSHESVCARLCDGVVVRTKTTQAQSDAVTMDQLKSIKGRPWAPHGAAKLDAHDQARVPDVPRPETLPQPPGALEPAIAGGALPRSLRITYDVIQKVGFSNRCSKCRMWS